MEWPLVGREVELRRLQDLIEDPESRGVIIAGPPGVGKTRLALEFMQIADRMGFATERVTATQSTVELPFGAFAPLLPALSNAKNVASSDRAELLRRASDALIHQVGGRRMLLFVDDAHMLDEASAVLVHQLALSKAAFVLATERSAELAPAPVIALWKDRVVERMELAGLDAERLAELVTTVLGGEVDAGTVALLTARAQGNVLFLRELILGGLEDKTLQKRVGIWHLVGETSPSNRLIELVEARLTGLNPVERALLELMSLGEPLGPAELATLADSQVAEELQRKGLLLGQNDGRRLQLRLAHPLYGEVLRARTPTLRARHITRSLAEALEATGARRREDLLRLATRRLAGGGGSPEVMLAAATMARWRYDFPLAERLARAAADDGGGFAAELLCAQLAALQGRSHDAEKRFARLATLAQTDAERCEVGLSRLDNAFFAVDPQDGLRIANETESSISDAHIRDQITARRSWSLSLTNGPRDSVEAARPLLERADGEVLVTACLAASYGLARLGEVSAALEATERSLTAHRALTEPLQWYPWMNLQHRCEALATAGRFEEHECLARAQYNEALELGSREQQAFFAWQLARTVAARGRVVTAAHFAREATVLFRELGRAMWERDSLGLLALAYALAGRTEEAVGTIAAVDDFDIGPIMYLSTDLLSARAWVAVSTGDLPKGRRLFEEAADLGEAIGDRVGATSALHDLARVGQAKAVTKRLDLISNQIEGTLATTRADHTKALVRWNPGDLEKASATFEQLGADLLAADAAADAAVAWRRHGNPRKSAASERRVATLLKRCEGPVTPAVQAIGDRAVLTPAERETAIIAATGQSNREIAKALYVSVRTVETRLGHIYLKLGISGREELAAVFQERP